MFPAHFRHEEEGTRTVKVRASHEVCSEDMEEMRMDEEGKRTIKVNSKLPKTFKEELKALFQ